MPSVRALAPEDLDWAVDVLARRRAGLVPYAPRYWRPAPDATARHTGYLRTILGDGTAVGARTSDGLMIAAVTGAGWVIDDAWVPADRWDTDGRALWDTLASRIGDEPVRFVCPVFEPGRSAFASHVGLELATSWWHLDIAGSSAQPGGDAVRPSLDGARAVLVPAPPVYDPGGPILFLRDVDDPAAVTGACDEGTRCGAVLIVVDQPTGTPALERALSADGFVRHCDFYTGTATPTRPGSPT